MVSGSIVVDLPTHNGEIGSERTVLLLTWLNSPQIHLIGTQEEGYHCLLYKLYWKMKEIERRRERQA